MYSTGRLLGGRSSRSIVRSGMVAVVAAALMALVLQPSAALAADVATAPAATVLPAVPTAVSATVGPGRSYVSFRASDARATSFTVTAWNGTAAAATATGTVSPILIWGLSYGSTYTFTVK